MFLKFLMMTLMVIIHQIVFSQSENFSGKRFYKNGRLKTELIEKGRDTIEYRKYYRNGQLKDSVHLSINQKKEHPFGIERTYYKNGRLSSITLYNDSNSGYKRHKYFASGELSEISSKPFGIQKSYNSKGEQIKQLDINKKDLVHIPKKYRHQKHLKIGIYSTKKISKKIYLANTNQKLILKSGVLTSMYINGTDSLLEHCNIEGVFNDSIIISKFDYDMSSSKSNLKLDSVFVLNVDAIESIYYSKKNTYKRYNTAMVCEIAGFDLIIVPILVSIVTGNVAFIADPFILSMIGTGVITYAIGRNLYKKMIPKKYSMSEWKMITH